MIHIDIHCSSLKWDNVFCKLESRVGHPRVSSEVPKFRSSEVPKFRSSQVPGTSSSQVPEFQVPKFPELQVPGTSNNIC